MTETGRQFRVPPQRILLASDFSPASDSALKYATAFTRYFRGELYLAHVSESPVATERAEGAGPQRDSAEAYWATSSSRDPQALADVVPSGFFTESGLLWPAISRLTERNEIDLLVLGSSGRSGIAKLLFGSKADEILIHTNCPVLITGPGVANQSDRRFIPRTLLYAADFTAGSKGPADYACSMAEQLRASLFFLHVTEDIAEEPLSLKVSPSEFFARRWQESHCAPSHSAVLPVYMVEYGPPDVRIVEIAEKLSVDLIVMGLHKGKHSALATHMPGPAAYDIAAHAACPVLAVPTQRP